MIRMQLSGVKRLMSAVLMLGAMMFALTPGMRATASGGGETTTGGTTVRLSNFNRKYNNSSPKGTVTLNYAADGTAQSIDYSLGSINVPDGTEIPVQIVMGRYQLVVSYYTYYGIVYTTYNGTLTINKQSCTLSLNKLNGDAVPDFPSATTGTIAVHIYSADGSTEILGGSAGTLKP